MAQDDLLFMTASRAAMLIRMRKLSPVEYLEAILVAAHQQQGRLNCFTAILMKKHVRPQGVLSRL